MPVTFMGLLPESEYTSIDDWSGKRGEDLCEEFIRHVFNLTYESNEDLKGVDGRDQNGKSYQIKLDRVAARTGNLYLEKTKRPYSTRGGDPYDKWRGKEEKDLIVDFRVHLVPTPLREKRGLRGTIYRLSRKEVEEALQLGYSVTASANGVDDTSQGRATHISPLWAHWRY
jgi:hypothetical protein